MERASSRLEETSASDQHAHARPGLERCIEDSLAIPSEIVPAFEMLFELMRRIDEGQSIVYFTDESGSWQLYVQWPSVIPAYLDSLAKTVTKDEHDRRVEALLQDFGGDASVARLDPRTLATQTWARNRL